MAHAQQPLQEMVQKLQTTLFQTKNLTQDDNRMDLLKKLNEVFHEIADESQGPTERALDHQNELRF